MDAKLHLNSFCTSLTLPVALDVPRLELESLDGSELLFCYQWKLGIKIEGETTTIQTVRGAGRGQANQFDKLVGPEIAALRLVLARQLRLIAADDPEMIMDEAQTVSVHVSNDEAEGILQSIRDFDASDERVFWGYHLRSSATRCSRFSESTWRELAEEDRVAKLSPEERLLEAIFGQGHQRQLR